MLQEVTGVLDVVKSVSASVAEDLKTDAHACSAPARKSDNQISATAVTLKCPLWGDAAQRTAWGPGLRAMPKRCQPDGATLTKHTCPGSLLLQGTSVDIANSVIILCAGLFGTVLCACKFMPDLFKTISHHCTKSGI